MAHAPFISCAHARYVTARFSKNAVHVHVYIFTCAHVYTRTYTDAKSGERMAREE